MIAQDDYPSVSYFQGKGLRVWGAGWNEPDAVRRLIEVARRDATEKMVGYLATTWVPVTDLTPALAGESAESVGGEPLKVVECVQLASELTRD